MLTPNQAVQGSARYGLQLLAGVVSNTDNFVYIPQTAPEKTNLDYVNSPHFICRILECEKQPGIAGDKVPVEIWDVSGDQA